MTNWWEAGFYLPFAANGVGEFYSDGAKIRSLFVVPDAAKRSFFYGVNLELGYEMPQFSQTPWNLEIRPIIGVRNSEWELIANPIVDVGFGPGGEADFAPALRLARNLGAVLSPTRKPRDTDFSVVPSFPPGVDPARGLSAHGSHCHKWSLLDMGKDRPRVLLSQPDLHSCRVHSASVEALRCRERAPSTTSEADS